MREIKFRAWIKRKNELMYLKGFRYSGNEKIKITFADEDCDDCTYTFLNKDVILEQFTGLHDKNGVEIYDGDIIEAWSQGTKAKGEIKQRIDGTWIMFPCWQNSEMWYLMPNNNGETTVEVIGNIHSKED